MITREGALKHLHTRLHDSVEGYEAAIERTESPYLKGAMQEMVQRRRANMTQIHTFLSQEGIEVSHDGSLLADAHRTFLKLKDSEIGRAHV